MVNRQRMGSRKGRNDEVMGGTLPDIVRGVSSRRFEEDLYLTCQV